MLEHSHLKNKLEAGCDEAGRGCLAGPVVAAAVILPPKISFAGLDDSKKTTEKKRLELAALIKKEAIAYAIAFVDHTEIDRINILNASFLAMSNAVKDLKIQPEHLLIDGNRFRTNLTIPFQCMVKGDGRFMNIAAASILAKTSRDAFMMEQHKLHPHYAWNKNKGYPTKAHREGIVAHGLSPIHRKSFRQLPEQLTLNL
jgi:ribonuclease HII